MLAEVPDIPAAADRCAWSFGRDMTAARLPASENRPCVACHGCRSCVWLLPGRGERSFEWVTNTASR